MRYHFMFARWDVARKAQPSRQQPRIRNINRKKNRNQLENQLKFNRNFNEFTTEIHCISSFNEVELSLKYQWK